MVLSKSGSTSPNTRAPVNPDPEAELIVGCVRRHLAGEATERQGQIEENLDWERVIRLAARHGVVPILYTGLSTTWPHAVPPVVLDQLRDQHQAAVQQNLALTNELLSLLGHLQAQDIPALAFKGPELALDAYGALALRPFGDLDLLVDLKDVPRAGALLVSQGYRLKAERDWQLFFLGEGKVGVDLHWKLGAEWVPDPGSFGDWCARARQVAVGGTAVPTPAVEDLLLILAVLLTKDCKNRRQRLIQICDVAALLRRHPAIDWASLFERARATGTLRMVLFQLVLAHELLGMGLPAQAADLANSEATVHRLAREVGSSFFLEADRHWDASHPRPGPGFTGHAFFLRSRERLVDKLHYMGVVLPNLLQLAVTPTEHDRAFLPLPAPLRPLYCLVRPVRVIRQWLRTGYLILD